jgi:hypothetical protein
MKNSFFAIVKNGKIEVLDKFYLPEDTKLIVTPLSNQDGDLTNWDDFALECLNNAYSEDEPEYNLTQIKEFNPNYEGN